MTIGHTSTPPIRGPLRYDVDTSSPQIEAGRPFSVFVRVTNPYDVPAIVHGMTTRLPAKFEDLEATARDRERIELTVKLQELTQSLLQEPFSVRSAVNEKREMLKDAAKDLLRALPFGAFLLSGYKVAEYATAGTLSSAHVVTGRILNPDSIDVIRQAIEQPNADPAAVQRAILDEVKHRLREMNAARRAPVILQPGNSTVHAFTLKTTQAVFFTPSSYNLSIQVEYEIDSNVNQEAISYRLDVRAPIKALIFGSVIGSVMGYLVKDIYDHKSLVGLLQKRDALGGLSWGIALLGAVLLGVLLVIAFARKKDTQPLISVEDFWGGVFVGFMAGYMGSSILDQVIPVSSDVAKSVPTA